MKEIFDSGEDHLQMELTSVSLGPQEMNEIKHTCNYFQVRILCFCHNILPCYWTVRINTISAVFASIPVKWHSYFDFDVSVCSSGKCIRNMQWLKLCEQFLPTPLVYCLLALFLCISSYCSSTAWELQSFHAFCAVCSLSCLQHQFCGLNILWIAVYRCKVVFL